VHCEFIGHSFVICPTTVLKKKSIQLSYTCLKEEKKTKEKQVELK